MVSLNYMLLRTTSLKEDVDVEEKQIEKNVDKRVNSEAVSTASQLKP